MVKIKIDLAYEDEPLPYSEMTVDELIMVSQQDPAALTELLTRLHAETH
jgi:hypothetical protein